jgi:metal-responsive CopG/Arc/MetJ family transcriptional regulator
MPEVRINLEQSTLEAIDRIVPPDPRTRAEFIRRAVKDAIFRYEQDEQEKMRLAYLRQPDAPEGGEIWDLPEEWKP